VFEEAGAACYGLRLHISRLHPIYVREFKKAILNSVADPLVVLSGDLRIHSGNRAFYILFGVSGDDTHGVPLYELANGGFDSHRCVNS
jgi:hypothetical protein